MSNLLSLTSSQLNQAAKLKDKITALEKELAGLLGGSAPALATVKAKLGRPPKKKAISAAGIAKIRAAQKARWAKIKSSKPTAKPTPKLVVKKKRTMSAAGRAKIAAAAKARWAKAKAAGKNTL
jgi:hypothetical protein